MNNKLMVIMIVGLLLLGGVGTFIFNQDVEAVSYNLEDDVNVESSINSYLKNGDLIIEYENPNDERVWIEGLSGERYSIGEDIVVYDYKSNEVFKLHIGDASDVYGFGGSIGYEMLDSGSVLHLWNNVDDYFFDVESGIQLTNHYEDYWTRNIYCLGYYNNDEWNKIKCADELTNFEKNVESDDETFVRATLYKNISYGEYDIKFGVEYDLGLDDKNLSITISIENIGIEIPYDLGFAWKITDWEIPHEEGSGGDSIFINRTDYDLDGTFDLTFRDMQYTYYNEELEEDVTVYDSYFRGYDWTEFLRVDWDRTLNYAVKMYGNGVQEDFYVALLIDAGHFNIGQEKSTTFQWIDAVGAYTGFHFDVNADGLAFPAGMTNNGTHLFITEWSDDEVYIYKMNGTLESSWDTGTGRDDPKGITTNNTFIWIFEDDDEELNKYYMNGTFIESYNFSNYSTPNSYLNGLTNNNTYIWLTAPYDKLIHRIYMNGTNASFEIDISGTSTYVGGITNEDNFLWVRDVVGTDYNHYKYYMNGTYSGEYFVADSVDHNSQGITSNGTYLWTVDDDDDEVYQYEIIDFPVDINIIYPTATTYTDVDFLNWTIGGDLEEYCWWSDDDGATNTSVTCGDLQTSITPVTAQNTTIIMWANDSSNNLVTDSVNFLLQDTSICGVYFNTTSPITFPETFAVYTNCSSAYTLTQNGTTISNASEIDSGASAFNFSVQRTDTYNYTDTVNEEEFVVNQDTTSICGVQFNETSPLDNRTFLVWSNCSSANFLTRNGTIIANNSAQNLAVGAYNFTTNRTDTYNYTEIWNSREFRLIEPALDITSPVNGTVAVRFDFLNWTTTNTDYCWYSSNGGADNTTVTCGDNSLAISPANGTTTIIMWANDSSNNLVRDNTTFTRFDFLEVSQSANESTYETKRENFTMAIGFDSSEFTTSSAALNYNGTEYAGTKTGSGDNLTFTKSLDIPAMTIDGNRSYYWNVTLNNGTDYYYQTVTKNITVENISLAICGTGLPVFLNYSFKDTATDVHMDASVSSSNFDYWIGGGDVKKNYAYDSATVENTDYTFCGYPNMTFHNDISFNYENSPGYVTHTETSSDDISNVTTTTILYLTGTANGAYTTLRLVNEFDAAVSGSEVQVERQIGVAWNVVGNAVSDDAGQVTFYLDTTLNHRFTIVTEGYETEIYIIRPSQSIYTVMLTSTTSTVEPDYYIGITSSILPSGNNLTNSTAYDFKYTLTSGTETVTEFGFVLYNSTDDSLDSGSAATNGGTVTVNLNTGNNTLIYMEYYFVIDGNYTNSTRVWYVQRDTLSGSGIEGFVTHLRIYLADGIFGMTAFGMGLMIFVLIFGIVGVANMKFGLTNSLGMSILVFLLVLFFDSLGFLEGVNPVGAVPHFPSFFIGLIVFITAMREVTR